MSGELSIWNSAIWPSIAPRKVYAQVCTDLAHAADLLQAPRVLMIWGEAEEPWIHLAMWSHDGFNVRQEPPSALDWLVARPLLERSFLCLDICATVPMVLYTSPTGPQHWFGPPSTHIYSKSSALALFYPPSYAEPPLRDVSFSLICAD